MPNSNNNFLMVLPPVILLREEDIFIDSDFANNLDAYLRTFDIVTIMCPATTSENTFPSVLHISKLQDRHRLNIVILPFAYREDRYALHRSRVSRLIKQHMRKSRYLSVSPHSVFDWSTLAAKIFRKHSLAYCMEADWDLPSARKRLIRKLPISLKKIKLSFTDFVHSIDYYNALKFSKLAMLQGDEVFKSLHSYAPNAHSVLNVQVTRADHIGDSQLESKIASISADRPLQIVYAGRADIEKGPLLWIDTLAQLRELNVSFEATWFGTGELIEQMRLRAHQLNLTNVCYLPGKVDRETVNAALQKADIFLFCHLTPESPRCLVEALSRGVPIVGFEGNFARGLVHSFGGGVFSELGQPDKLAETLYTISQDRTELRKLVAQAARTGSQFDRDVAIQNRINLIKRYL